jgi:hypothetical protein
MTPQDWESPATFAAPAQGNPEAAAYALRPLTTGEVLDRTFSIYRAHFWLFAGLASIAASIQLLANATVMVVAHFVRLHYGPSMGFGARALGGYPVGLIFFLVSSVTQAATIFALAEVYLGRIATAPLALRAVMSHWYRYIGIALWQTWSALWVAALLIAPAFVIIAMKIRSLLWLQILLLFLGVFGGMAYGIIAYLRNALGVQASVVEHLKVRAAMRRSKTLGAGALGRIFLVLLIAGVLLWVAGVVQLPLTFLLIRSPNEEHVVAEAIILLVAFVANTLVPPVAMIGLSLVYFDQRVRKEAFDLVMLLGGDTPVETAAFAAPLDLSVASRFDVPVAAPLDVPVAAPLDVPVAAPLAAPVTASAGDGEEGSIDPAEPIGDDGRG